MRRRDRQRVTVRQAEAGGLIQAARLDAHVDRATVLDQSVEVFDARSMSIPAPVNVLRSVVRRARPRPLNFRRLAIVA